ncbi:phage tail-collar fiber domain-containing protein [Aeromonas sp. 80P]
MSNFGAILTNAGAAKLANAIALGVPLKLTQMAVGDGNGQPVAPDPAMTAIPGEKRRAAINTLFADPLAASQLVAEQIIPEDVGGWWIRCVGLFDDSNTLIAVANVPDTYKPLLTSGAGRTQIIRMVLIVSDTSAVELKIDPAVVLASRKYVDDVMKAHKESRDHPDASDTAKGFVQLATEQEVNEQDEAKRSNKVITVKMMWKWLRQASETMVGFIRLATQAEIDSRAQVSAAVRPHQLRELAVGQRWTDMLLSRAMNTVYTNSTGKPIALSVSVQATGAGASIQISIDGVTISRGTYNYNGSAPTSNVAIIPAGATYSVALSGGSGIISVWYELR